MGWKWNASKRVLAAEFRAARWLARNPGWMLAPSVVAAGAVHFRTDNGRIRTRRSDGGATGLWYRGHPGSFDTLAAPVATRMDSSLVRRLPGSAVAGPDGRSPAHQGAPSNRVRPSTRGSCRYGRSRRRSTPWWSSVTRGNGSGGLRGKTGKLAPTSIEAQAGALNG